MCKRNGMIVSHGVDACKSSHKKAPPQANVPPSPNRSNITNDEGLDSTTSSTEEEEEEEDGPTICNDQNSGNPGSSLQMSHNAGKVWAK